jgi:DegV family protein with EDD domain
MASIQVVTDSACDLSPTTAEERDVRVVPLTIRFGSEELVDRDELSGKEFWDRVITGPDMPATAAPSPGAFQQAFLDAHEAGASGVVAVMLSSGLSATYQSACTAAEAVADRIPVRVVDTLSVTMGQGLLVLAAADLVSSGASLDAVATELEDMKDRTHVFGVVDSLDYLRRGGRIGGAAQLVGSLLSIKPVIHVVEGVVEVESKQRTRSRALAYLANKAIDAGPLDRLGATNGAAPDFEEVLDMLRKASPEHELVTGELGPVVGSHAGPASVGVCFITRAL